MQATERAIRGAALQLMTERGYEATSTDDIARAAGVSRRTFFNYFPTKEAVLFLPVDILPGMIGATLRARPLGEDPASSTVAAIAATFEQFAQFIGADAATLVRGQMRLVLTEPTLRRITFERRVILEETIWLVHQERGVSPEDLGARAAVATVVSMVFLGLTLWASSEVQEPLLAVVARCLLAAPHPSRLAAGLTGGPLLP
ncbi:MAG TPA: TetR family transcriptional regulator [Acidimicrobiales bacterium]|jgi:AcrR family transcriptional regulator